MVDSIQRYNSSPKRFSSEGRQVGRLHKGHNISAASASIPSRYQTFVIDNSDRKGFSGTAKRFQNGIENDHPGPGAYAPKTAAEVPSTSYSKKGSGAFPSKNRRIMRYNVTAGPGPGKYGVQHEFESRRDFNQYNTSRAFHRPIAVCKTDPNESLPAPNHYNPDKIIKVQKGKRNNVNANAAFKSKTKREMINLVEAASKPSPFEYQVKDDITKSAVKVPMSSFKSKTLRKFVPDPPPFPGPGAYKPDEPIDPIQKTVFPRKHYLCISAPAMPLPDSPPFPGPGQYDVPDTIKTEKHYMSGSSFVSSTTRWAGDLLNRDQPGPAHYRPTGVGKQSFIYNATGRWIA